MTIGLNSITEDQSWAARGACVSMDPDGFFVQGAEQNRAKTTCVACPVKTECLADALDNRIDFGVWGGMTERERRRLLRRHPHVTDWAAAPPSPRWGADRRGRRGAGLPGAGEVVLVPGPWRSPGVSGRSGRLVV